MISIIGLKFRISVIGIAFLVMVSNLFCSSVVQAQRIDCSDRQIENSLRILGKRVGGESKAISNLFKVGDECIDDLIVILNGNDFQMSVAAQEAVRYLGNEKGLRALDNWNKANKRSYPVWGPVPIPIIDFDYEMIDLLLIEDDKQVVGLALSRYIYALAIDRKSSKSEVLLQKVLQRLRSVENESITNRIVNRLKSNYPLKPFSETKTVEDAVLENAFFLSEEDKKVTRAELLSFNAKGDKALIELHLSRGFLAEEWYHVVVEKEVNGWKFFSITFTKQS